MSVEGDRLGDRFADALRRASEDAFPAPSASAPGTVLTLSEDAVTLESAPERRRGTTVLIATLALAFLVGPALVVSFAGWEAWPVLLASLMGILLGAAAVASASDRTRIEVRRDGIRVAKGGSRAVTFHPAEDVAEIRFVRIDRRDPDDSRRVHPSWRVGALLRSGAIVGILEHDDRGRARAAAEAVERLLAAGRGSPVPQVDRSLGNAADAPAPLDATLAERATAERSPAPLPNDRFDVERDAGAIEIRLARPGAGRALLAAAPFLPFAVLFTLAGGAFAAFLLGAALAPVEPVGPGLRALFLALLVLPLAFVAAGLYSTLRVGLSLTGVEYLRVDASAIERGFRLGGRSWNRERLPLSAAEGAAATGGLTLFDGGRPRRFGFEAARREDRRWLVGALQWAARESARAAPSGAPPGWPFHPRIRVEQAGRAVRIVATGARWGWLGGMGLVFGALTLGGLAAFAALLYGAFAWMPEAPLPMRLGVAAFAAAPGVMAWWGGRALRGVWSAFGPGEDGHVVADGALAMEGSAIRIDLRRIERVKIDHGNVVVATDEGDVTLAFQRLSRAEDLEWARAAVEHAVRRG